MDQRDRQYRPRRSASADRYRSTDMFGRPGVNQSEEELHSTDRSYRAERTISAKKFTPKIRTSDFEEEQRPRFTPRNRKSEFNIDEVDFNRPSKSGSKRGGRSNDVDSLSDIYDDMDISDIRIEEQAHNKAPRQGVEKTGYKYGSIDDGEFDTDSDDDMVVGRKR